MSGKPTPCDLEKVIVGARQAVLRMKENLVMGMKPELAAAFALVELERRSKLALPKKSRMPAERCDIRLEQALQIAIGHYQRPEVVKLMGTEQAERMRDEFLELLYEFTDPN